MHWIGRNLILAPLVIIVIAVLFFGLLPFVGIAFGTIVWIAFIGGLLYTLAASIVIRLRTGRWPSERWARDDGKFLPRHWY